MQDTKLTLQGGHVRRRIQQSEHLIHPKYRPDIDGLRAIAVLSVVGFHAFPSWIKGGFVGVDIFFVISGFLISTIIFGNLQNNTFSFLEFYSRRIKRIFPALLVVLIACYAFGWLALLADEYKQLGKHIAAGAGFVSNFVLWSENGYFDNDAETKPLLHLWSLGIEEQFYIVWPLLLWVQWKTRFNLLAIILAMAMVSFALNIRGIQNDAVATFYSPKTRFWELLVGSLLAWAALYGKTIKYHHRLDHWLSGMTNDHAPTTDCSSLRNGQAWLGGFLIMAAIVLTAATSRFPGWWAVLPTLGAGLMIVAGSDAWINRVVLSNRLLVWIGVISYPLYLWHWPLLSFARIIESQTPSVLIRSALVLASIALAWITYRFIEHPIRFGSHGKNKSIILALIMIGVGGVGLLLFVNQGVPDRESISGFEENKKQLIRTENLDQDCLRYIGRKKPGFYYCRFNDVGANETVAIIGDSHAHAAYPGVAELFKELGKNTVLIANTGCPPFIGGEYGDSPDERARCKENINKILDLISSRSDVKDVIIFSLGAINISGTAVDGVYPNVKDLTFTPIPKEVFRSSLQKTINFLKKSGKTVFYIAENPEFGFDVKGCLGRPFTPSGLKCEEKKADVEKRQKEYLDLINSLQDVKVIHVLDSFCRNNACSVFHEDRLLYADRHHLSIYGSKFQAREIIAPFFK